ncbi:MAG: DUF1475 family protein [Phycisphaerales bacterium]|nr:DUF1475 family protein [Phycisphaerales bacterium]
MRWACLLTSVCLAAMIVGLGYGFGFGDGWSEVRVLLDFPWFVVSLVDVYVGFILFGIWIAMRESRVAASVWILLILTLGNVISCVYVLRAIALHRSRGVPWFPATRAGGVDHP